MCGRVHLETDYSEIKIQLKFDLAAPAPSNLPPRYNMPPTSDMLVAIRSIDGKRIPKMMYWGLVPHFAPAFKVDYRYKTFNARSETAATSRAFRRAWQRGQRCIVVVDGFFEWKSIDGSKRSFAVGMAERGRMMTMAGLWDVWVDPTTKDERLSCTILTCEPNAAMAAIHDRMPCIISEDDWPAWLGEVPATDDELHALLRSCPDAWLRIWEVDKRVGNVRNDDADLLLPI